MIFNPDSKKPAHGVIFSRKKYEVTRPSVFYNDIEVSRTDSQKHLGLVLDNKLTFKKHTKDKFNIAFFGVGKIKRLRDILPRDSLVTIYKSFIRPHLDYGDVIYDQPNNDSFSDKIEQLQYKACLAITGAIQETSRECLNNVLRLERLSSRRWCRKLCAICKTKKKTDCFKYSFFPNSLSE